jgi:cell division protein ZapE
MGSGRLETLNSVADAYRRLAGEGRIEHDPVQAVIAGKLDRIIDEIVSKRLAEKKSALGWLFARRTGKVEGLYIHGAVGRGKTMLMDLFFERVPVRRKRRAHFNAFMADVHDRIASHRAAVKAGRAKGDDPMPPVAAAIAAEARVLCFDEFSVTDIADAMILSRLFSALFAAGTVLVATSNVAPRDLYRDGLNRGLFLPFIDILEAHLEVVTLDARKDYRLDRTDRAPVYLWPLDEQAARAVDEAWRSIAAGEEEKPATVTVKGRRIEVGRTAGRAARFEFDELCARPLAARDYLALAGRFDTFVIENVPPMDAAARNEAKRFILLIDTLYDRRRRLIMSAGAPPAGLYRAETGTEAFEFRRTASRLIEMQTEGWATERAEPAAGAG